MGGDHLFTYVCKSQTAERIRAAEQERLAAEVRSAYRQQQLAARLRRHQVELTASNPAEVVEAATVIGQTLGGPVGMDVKACTPAGSYFVPLLAVPRDGPTSRRRMLAALDVTAETIVASIQRGPSGKKWRRVENAKG